MKQKNADRKWVVRRLSEVPSLPIKGATLRAVCKKIGISLSTYYRWRRECAGVSIEIMRSLETIALENSLLRKLVAELSLERAILKEAMEA